MHQAAVDTNDPILQPGAGKEAPASFSPNTLRSQRLVGACVKTGNVSGATIMKSHFCGSRNLAVLLLVFLIL